METGKGFSKHSSLQKIPVEEIMSAIQSVRFGDVQIVIQDSRVIQINKTEKVRFEHAAEKGA